MANYLKGLSDYTGKLLGDVGNALDGLTGVATTALDKYAGLGSSYIKAKNAFDPPDRDPVVQKTPVNSTYDANVTPGDVLAEPNYSLLFGGAALLILALFLSKR